MALRDAHRAGAWHRRGAETLLGGYRTRMMLALVASLGLVTACFHLPLDQVLRPIGWQVHAQFEKPFVFLEDVEPQDEAQLDGGAIITRFDAQLETPPEDKAEQEVLGEAEEPSALPLTTPPVEKLNVRQAVLEFAEEPPNIEGGLGAYYIHIEYPKEAIAANIQGRLILSFVVEPDGRPSEIEVVRSLHPLCDSSAVRALRQTRFVPGRQNGEAVRVRMRLPVQFRIVDEQQPGEKR